MQATGMPTGMRLSVKDMRRLATNPSSQARSDVGGKIAATLSAGVFSDNEALIAVEILRMLVRDSEMQVRRSIADNLRDSLNIPHEMILSLASDVEEVALPLLQYSYVLTEDDLVALVAATREVAKLIAIASRESVSAELSEALMDTEITEVMATLFANKGAKIRDSQLLSRWGRIGGDATLLEVLVHRGGLSMVVAEKLYAAVSDELKPVLNRQYKLPMILVEEAGEETREWTTLALALGDALHEPTEQEVEKLVEQLYAANRLTYSLIMRSLCIGDLAFFETAMARLAGVPRGAARLLMFDSGPLGFRAFYERARMPEGFFEAVRLLLRFSLEETSYGRMRRDDFRNRVVARIQSGGFDRTVENMHYLLTIIGGKIATAETLH